MTACQTPSLSPWAGNARGHGLLLGDLLAAFLVPDFAKQIHAFLIVVPAIAEIWMGVYLPVKSVKSGHQADRAPVANLAPVAH